LIWPGRKASAPAAPARAAPPAAVTTSHRLRLGSFDRLEKELRDGEQRMSEDYSNLLRTLAG